MDYQIGNYVYLKKNISGYSHKQFFWRQPLPNLQKSVIIKIGRNNFVVNFPYAERYKCVEHFRYQTLMLEMPYIRSNILTRIAYAGYFDKYARI